MLTPQNNIELLKAIEKEHLMGKLIEQLNKDFRLANVNKQFEAMIDAKSLKIELDAVILDLLSNNYNDYLNLLYRIDISEKELAYIKDNQLSNAIEQISFLILKREFQKVWLKHKYS